MSDTPRGVPLSAALLAYRRGVENLAGVGVLAIAALWAMYLLPQRVLQRTQVVEARTDDRHSGAMRILAVARRSGREDPGTTHDCPPGQVPHGRLLTGPMPVVIAQPTAAAEGVLTMDRPVIASQRRPGAPAGHTRGGSASPARPAAPASRASEAAAGHPAGDRPAAGRPAADRPAAGRPAAGRPSAGRPAAAPVRLSAAARARAEALAARRAAAARRRLALTLTLLASSAIAWTAVSAFSIHVAVPAVLTVALAGVLTLGRRAVVTARRADAEAARRAGDARPQATTGSQAASARTDAARTVTARADAARDARRAGAARGASVTGRAVHGSQTTTQMISSAEVLERTTASTATAAGVAERDTAAAPATASATSSASQAPAAPAAAATSLGSAASGSTTVGSAAPAALAGAPVEQAASDDEAASAVREVVAAGAAEGRVRGTRQADEARRTDDSERVLGGFSLPRPTYTMKAAAPRREVAPLADADVTTPANAAERAAASAASVGSAEEPATTTEGLGLGLDAILARRRASGA